MCEKTEFEVEGWRKIPPLMEILEQQHIPTGVLERMKLEMIQIPPNFTTRQLDEARADGNSTTWRSKLGEKRFIKDSWIYRHFKDESTNKTKIAIYVNAVVPINQHLEKTTNQPHEINNVGNHCVVVCGIKYKNGIEGLELENNGGCEETRFIPVEFPFFEEIQIEVNKINAKYCNKGVENYDREMNNLGKKWALQKWGKLEKQNGKNWYEQEKESTESKNKVDGSKKQWKYQMLFVRGIYPCFQLKFTS